MTAWLIFVFFAGIVIGIIAMTSLTKSVIKDVKCRHCGRPISTLNEEKE